MCEKMLSMTITGVYSRQKRMLNALNVKKVVAMDTWIRKAVILLSVLVSSNVAVQWVL